MYARHDNDNSAGSTLFCPNCGAVRPPSGLICRSCGINLLAYAQLIAEVAKEDRATAPERPTDDVARSLRQALVQLGITVVVIITLMVLGMYAVASFHQSQVLLADEQSVLATGCLQRGDIACAQRSAHAALHADPSRYEMLKILRIACQTTADQYSAARLWRDAELELNTCLDDLPSDALLLQSLRETYNRWEQDAITRGDTAAAEEATTKRRDRFGE